MYQHLYRKFLENQSSGTQPQIWMTAHSHHFWPDCTRQAQLDEWDDAARLVDDKWNLIFGELMPEVQKGIARELGITHSDQIAFAGNTHEFIVRLISTLESRIPVNQPLRILTTDSEFHSFSRQASRLTEIGKLELTKVPVFPYETFSARFESELKSHQAHKKFDLVFLSEVFFNSGLVAPIQNQWPRLAKDAPFVVDGYHGFFAIPGPRGKWIHDVFYVGGGYKYLQAGEGVAFLSIPSNLPKDSPLRRPVNTGWFAAAATLSESSVNQQVAYPENYLAWMGSTLAPTGLYRCRAVFREWEKHGITSGSVHQWILELQSRFLKGTQSSPILRAAKLLHMPQHHPMAVHGHFLTFDFPSAPDALTAQNELKTRGIRTDLRGTRLRFGFGMQHSLAQIDELIRRMSD